MINNTLTTELFWLTLTLTMTALMWVPYILNRLNEQGTAQAIMDPEGDKSTRIAWAQRMMQAHQNAVENLAVFAPLVLILHVTGINNETTAVATAVYFYARATHYLVYTFGIPVIRTLAFATGFGATIVLALTLLNPL